VMHDDASRRSPTQYSCRNQIACRVIGAVKKLLMLKKLKWLRGESEGAWRQMTSR
jgi:hypothetical protein